MYEFTHRSKRGNIYIYIYIYIKVFYFLEIIITCCKSRSSNPFPTRPPSTLCMERCQFSYKAFDSLVLESKQNVLMSFLSLGLFSLNPTLFFFFFFWERERAGLELMPFIFYWLRKEFFYFREICWACKFNQENRFFYQTNFSQVSCCKC